MFVNYVPVERIQFGRCSRVAFMKGFDDREMSNQVKEKQARKLCLSQGDETETRRNSY